MATETTSIQTMLSQLVNFEIPVICDLTEIRSVLTGSDVSTGDIYRLSGEDPVFSLYAQRVASDLRKGRGGEINGLEHALSMLGMEQTRNLIQKLKQGPRNQHPYFYQLLSESILASQIAAELAQFKKLHIQEIKTVALYSRVVEWLTYWHNPRKSWQVRRMFYRRPFSSDSVSDIVFGFKYTELQAIIAKEFGLPFLNQRIADFSIASVARELVQVVHEHRKQTLVLENFSRQLRLHLSAPEMLPIIANKLAQAMCSPWLVNTLGRWMDLAAIHCHVKNSEIIHAMVHAAAKTETVTHSLSEFPCHSRWINETSKTPYSQFIVNRQAVKQQLQAQLQTAKRFNTTVQATNTGTEKVQSKKTASELTDINKLTLKYTPAQRLQINKLYLQLIQSPSEFKDLQQIVSTTIDVLLSETPLSRVGFLAINKAATQVKSLLFKSKNIRDKPPIFNTTLEKTPVLNSFTKKQSFLKFEREKHQKYWKQFPDIISKDQSLECFLLNSLQYNGKVRAFIYADITPDSQDLIDTLADDFKRIAKGLAAALKIKSADVESKNKDSL